MECLNMTLRNFQPSPAGPPRVGCGAVKIGTLRFLTGGSKSRTKSGFRLYC